ncbi:MAG: hypothetical protein GXO22_04605 [Aquificae bacterium]|nr:hypothetical protein [Aquificota bacterium]
MKISIVIYNQDKTQLKNLTKSLEENDLSMVGEILYTGKKEDTTGLETSLVIEPLELDTENKAYLKNVLLGRAKEDYILWLSTNTVLEDTTIAELIETAQEHKDADVIYPNEVIIQDEEEIVRNFDDLYKRENLILHNLSIEDNLPEFGILLKKDKFKKLGGFDEQFEDFDFYKFVYDNINEITVKHSDLSFVEYHITEDFIDTSYRSKAIRDTVSKYDWKTEIFPYLSWEKEENSALATAYTFIGDKLSRYHDFFNASQLYTKALLTFHNKLSFQSLINAYLNMGLFEEAKALITSQQTLKKEEKDSMIQRINQTQKFVKTLEESIKEGKTGEILLASKDIIDFYQGAPVYNLFGVVYYLMNDLENAYKFFYKGVIINPLEENIVKNLVDVAKQIGKEESVKNLIYRIVPQQEKVA